MSSCCEPIADHFDEEHLDARLAEAKKGGLPIATQILLEALSALNLENARLLDVGGGTGTIMFVLFEKGIRQAVLVEIAAAYLEAAETESQERGVRDRVDFVEGDFVQVSEQIQPADVVTLDRVVCCYPDMEALVQASVRKSLEWYALSYPRDRWWARVVIASENWLRRLRGDPFTAYVHDVPAMEAILDRAGFERQFLRRTWLWEVSIYRRSQALKMIRDPDTRVGP